MDVLHGMCNSPTLYRELCFKRNGNLLNDKVFELARERENMRIDHI